MDRSAKTSRVTSLLQLEGVAVSRGERTLLEGLSLRVDAGDLLWIKGPNGSGKSTLLRAMAGLLQPMEGSLAHAHPPQESVAYLAHRNGFDPQARVRTTSRFWLQANQQDHISSVLDTTITRDRRMAELSAGQMRKLEILRLLGGDRPLWLLDEPYASLDADSAHALTATIARHVENGGACVVASHSGLPTFGLNIRTLSIGVPA